MKISLSWLRQYVQIDINPSQVADLLTNIGLEVEGQTVVEMIKGGLKGLLIGEVISCQRHPNADKLSLTTVKIAEDKILSVVCGAPNVAAGQKVVVATENTTVFPTVGEPFTIKKSKVRGEVSEAMICAQDEIGLGQSHEGILVLPADAPVGMTFAEYQKLESDIVWDINLTPNRCDAMGHFGVAFDLAAAMQIQLQTTAKAQLADVAAFAELPNSKNLSISVLVSNAQQCPRYAGICIENVSVQPSPQWLQKRLIALGLNPINNIVDISNFVLHELGQPLHVFDYQTIANQQLIVQTLPTATKFKTLDGTERSLHADDLMICDGENRPLCMAGIFGGELSGVKAHTKNIFIEVAHFHPTQIRRSSMRHNLRTDAATRFEKTTDINQILYALQRAALLIITSAGGSLASDLLDFYPQPVAKVQVKLYFANVSRLLGLTIPKIELKAILVALHMDILSETETELLLAIPSNKADVNREADVIEEILRIYGYNRVETPATLSSILSFETRPNLVKVKNIVADMFANVGFHEIMATSMTKSAYFKQNLPALVPELVYVNNTANQHLDIMRADMVFSGLEIIAHNQNRQNSELRLYEFGKTYQQKGEKKYQESQHLALFMTGATFASNWLRQTAQATDFFHLKSAIELLFQRLGITASAYQQQNLTEESELFAFGLQYGRGKQLIVQFGQLKKSIQRAFGIKNPVFYADFHWEVLLKMIEKQKIGFKSLPKFPAVRRDLALLVDKSQKFAQIEEIANKTAKKLLKEIYLFDHFESEAYDAMGKKSYAVSFLFQDEQKTLKDADIDAVMSQLIAQLDKQIQATVRK